MSVGSNLTPVIPPTDTEGVARIVGGVGGIRFQWEELDNGAQIISNAASELRQIWVSVTRIGTGLSAVRAYGDFLASGSSTAAGIAAIEAIQSGLRRLSEDDAMLTGTADRIRRSRMLYELAEFNTRDHISHAVAELLPSVPFVSRDLQVEQTRTDSIRIEGTVDALLSRVSHARDEPGSSFEVLEVEGRSGPAYVVVIPGTEGTDPALPFSAGGIAEAKFEDSRYVNEAVASALAEVGAEEGANVTLVGYSQGGMHAVNLANSGQVSEAYSVDLVITAGSPITEEEVPEKTTFLHLAHDDDWVPALNFAPATDRPNQVSVVLDHRVPPVGDAGPGLGAAHRINSYREGAQAVDMSSHPSLAPITAALGTAVVGSTARRHVFQITRPPVLGPQHAPPGALFGERKGMDSSAPGARDRPRDK